MRVTFARFLRRIAVPSLVFFCAAALFPAPAAVRYLSFAEVRETLGLFAGSGLPGADISSAATWDRWIRDQDAQVRRRIDRGTEDSISNLILYGTSYTSLPRLENAESTLTPTGELSEPALARIRALAEALRAPSPNERIGFVRAFLKREGVSPAATEQLLVKHLRRFAEEQQSYQRKLAEAQQSGDVEQRLSARGTLYQARGLSVDTSVLVNYGLEDTLRTLMEKGLLAKGAVRRIAVIGPGLDFTNKHSGYDFYPLQTLQPFAVMEAVLRLKLGRPDDIEVVTMDLNPEVNAHIANLVRAARAGKAYTMQLPGETSQWTAEATAYWEHLGDIIGVPATPLPAPAALGGVTVRAVSVAPRFASRVKPLDLNVVAQRVDWEPGKGFDLVVATNILVYYDRFEQALAMASIALMMNPGGIFLANDALSAHHTQALEFLDRHTVAYALDRSYGDNVLAYRRK